MPVNTTIPMFSTAWRYWETARHLKLQQFAGRLRLRLPVSRNLDGATPSKRRTISPWQPPAGRAPSLVGPRCFRFLNEQYELAEIGWDNPAIPLLWRYNQHYFDDLNARDAEVRRSWHAALIEDWLEANPPARGTAWAPYPTSLRIVNWVKYALSGNPLSNTAEQSLAMQTRWLMRRIEWHLLGNHLFANAKALIFAGLYFEGAEADRRLNKGRTILEREITEQILDDGGHFELSTMYHALAIEDMLDLFNVLQAYANGGDHHLAHLQSSIGNRVPKMFRWLDAMSHPDGDLAFFNDAAFGIAAANEDLHSYARRLGLNDMCGFDAPLRLAKSGYARLEVGKAVALLDIAAVGPQYLPGHAHADTLSFEFSMGQQRIFVNSGTSVYGLDAKRQRQRGTAAHNTVEIEGENSSDVWAGFRVGRRARITEASIHTTGGVQTARGAHDGYRYLRGRPVHTREWSLSQGKLRVVDELSRSDHSAIAYFHLHPTANIVSDSATHGTITAPEGPEIVWRADGKACVTENRWHPQFGMDVPSQCLAVELHEGRGALELTWNDA